MTIKHLLKSFAAISLLFTGCSGEGESPQSPSSQEFNDILAQIENKTPEKRPDEKIQIRSTEGLRSLKDSASGQQIPPDSLMKLPGLIEPTTTEAKTAPVDDGEEVLGLSVGDAHRAYLLSAFNLIGQKIVNDVVNRVPVTVTYCLINQKGRVFTSDIRGENLELDLYAWEKGEWVFELNDEPFPMFDENAPLDDYPFNLMTWGEWKKRHPNTDIYTGVAKIPVRQDE
tara:strand:- start:377 stop:1060 length:684 start_codon:yes stop_codon:yes gene_type:complete